MVGQLGRISTGKALHLLCLPFLVVRMNHENVLAVKQRLYDAHLAPLKIVSDSTGARRDFASKQHRFTRFPSVVRSTSSRSILYQASTKSPLSHTNSPIHDAAQRFIVQHHLLKVPQPSLSALATYHPSLHKQRSAYGHISAKVNTGLSRLEIAHRHEPLDSIDTRRIKHDLEQDVHIRAQANRIQFNAGITYTTQLTSLNSLVQSKVKAHLSSGRNSDGGHYKTIVHLTIFPTTANGLHVASRCLWNRKTDHSITFKMQGLDCDILIIVFLCYDEPSVR